MLLYGLVRSIKNYNEYFNSCIVYKIVFCISSETESVNISNWKKYIYYCWIKYRKIRITFFNYGKLLMEISNHLFLIDYN